MPADKIKRRGKKIRYVVTGVTNRISKPKESLAERTPPENDPFEDEGALQNDVFFFGEDIRFFVELFHLDISTRSARRVVAKTFDFYFFLSIGLILLRP